jgi:hypothetical protein
MATLTNKKLELLAWKVKNDPIFYMENFLKIRNKKSKLVPFQLNNAQKIFEDIIAENTRKKKLHRYIVLKARQLGISTYSTARMFHDTATHELVNTMIIAHEDKATQNLFNMSKLYFENLPPSLMPMKKYSNEKALVFENPTNDEVEKQANPGLRSKITVATAGTSETGRSGNIKNLHVSELAFFPNPENTMTALLQSIPDEPDTMVVLESTANGVGGYFYDMWQQSVKGLNDYTPIFLPWFTDPEYTRAFPDEETHKTFMAEVNFKYKNTSGNYVYTEEYLLQKQFNLTDEQLYWRRYAIANKCGGSVDIFKQEYPSTPEEAFIATGRPRFDLKVVKQYELNAKEPIKTGFFSRVGKSTTVEWEDNEKGYVKIYQMPKPNMTYVIGSDVAEGLVTGDYSVGIVLDENCDVVCLWRGHIDPDLFGKQLVAMGYFYNEAYIIAESNNHGLTTIKSILNEDYYNVHYSLTFDKIANEMTKKVGWQTNAKTKPIAIDKLAEFVREFLVGIPSLEIIQELYTYVIDDKGKTNAQLGSHDDCVMALAIAIQGYLEGKGELFLPEKTDMFQEQQTKKHIDYPEIIDPLFEGYEDIECT